MSRFRVRSLHAPPVGTSPDWGPMVAHSRRLSYHRTLELAANRANYHETEHPDAEHLQWLEVSMRLAARFQGDPPKWRVVEANVWKAALSDG